YDQRQGGKHRKKNRGKPRRCDCVLAHMIQGLNSINRRLRIDLIHRLAHKNREAHRISLSAHQKIVGEAALREWNINLIAWLAVQAVFFDDPDYSGDGCPGLTAVKAHFPPDRILVIPAMTRG